MKITYDPEAGAVYIEIRQAEPSEAVDVTDGVTADLDAKGRIIGLEILDASEVIGVDSISSITVELLTDVLKKTA